MGLIIPDKEDMQHLGQKVYTDGKYAFKFDYTEMPQVFMKLPDSNTGEPMFNEVVALQRVKGVRGCQQLVGFIDGVLVTELIPGNNLAFNDGVKEVPYTNRQLEVYFKTLVEMGKKGVTYDQKPKNIMFSQEEGFTPIDYITLNPNPMPDFEGFGMYLFPILDALSQQDHDGDHAARTFHYARMLEAFHNADPQIAKLVVLKGYDPRHLKKTFYEELSHASRQFRLLNDVFQQRYDMTLEQAVNEQ